MSKIVYQSLPFNCHRIDLLSQNINIYQQALVSLHIAIMYICFTVIQSVYLDGAVYLMDPLELQRSMPDVHIKYFLFRFC